MIIEFFVGGEIKGKGNSKSIVRAKNGRTFLVEPKANRLNAEALRLLFSQHAPPRPIEGPVRVTYQIQYAWRKGDGPKKRALGMVPKDTRPDLGQLEKALDDVCQAAGLIVDDAQIVGRCDHMSKFGMLLHGKFHTHAPGVHVRIAELTPAPRP